MKKRDYKHKLYMVAMAVGTSVLWVSTAMGAYPQTITTSTPFVNIPRPTDDPLWATAFPHWDNRGNQKEVMAAVPLFEKIAQAHPDKIEAHIWLARVYYLVGIREKNNRREWLGKSEKEAERALAIDPNNGFAFYWKYAAVGLNRRMTPAEQTAIRNFGRRFENTRELVVPTNDPAWKEALKHWDKRWDKAEALKAIDTFDKLDKKYPNRIEPKLWMARSHYYLHYKIDDEDKKKARLLVALNHARRAIKMEPRNPAANWWAAASLGQYVSHAGPLEVARNAMDLLRLITVVLEEDPNYFYGGLSQFMTLGLARAGNITRKFIGILGYPMDQIENLVTFASIYEPRYLRNYYALGELYIATGKMDEAKKELEYVINADPAALKMMEPENRSAQILARKLLEEHFK